MTSFQEIDIAQALEIAENAAVFFNQNTDQYQVDIISAEQAVLALKKLKLEIERLRQDLAELESYTEEIEKHVDTIL